jgi:flavin-dependent dehydrogenase
MQKLSLSNVRLGYDIAIVGAGPSGCFLAKNLSKNYRVLLIDYRSIPRHKACSGVIVRQGIEILKKLNPPEEIFLSPKELDFVYLDWTNGIEKHSKKAFWNTNREKLDFWLFSLLNNDNNIDFVEKTRLLEFKYSADKKHIVLLLESNGDIKNVVVNYLVGCDGAYSTIRQKINNSPPKKYVAIQELIPGNQVNKAYFIFDETITDWYAWVIPKGNRIDVGAALDPFKSREKFELFKKKVEKEFGIKGKGFFDSALLSRPMKAQHLFLGTNRILLAGEAAGLISPSSGEGISFALKSGKFLANAFNKNFKNPLKEYKKECKILFDRIKKKFLKSKLISVSKKRVKLMKK